MSPTPHLKAELDQLIEGADLASHLERDPIRFVHRYADPLDQEVISIFAALLAYGRVSLIGRALEELTARIGPHPFAAAQAQRSDAEVLAQFDGFVYRLTRGEDLARLWQGVSALIAAHGSLGAALTAFDDPAAPNLSGAIAGLGAAVRAATPGFERRQAFEHFLPDPAKGSACKRWWMWLRWMVRGPDEIDLGLWRHLGPHRLLMPLDTHIHRLSRYLGLTTRKSADGKTAAEITAALRALSPDDPLRYDFALAHLGISGQCPTHRVASICAHCGIRTICSL